VTCRSPRGLHAPTHRLDRATIRNDDGQRLARLCTGWHPHRDLRHRSGDNGRRPRRRSPGWRRPRRRRALRSSVKRMLRSAEHLQRIELALLLLDRRERLVELAPCLRPVLTHARVVAAPVAAREASSTRRRSQRDVRLEAGLAWDGRGVHQDRRHVHRSRAFERCGICAV